MSASLASPSWLPRATDAPGAAGPASGEAREAGEAKEAGSRAARPGGDEPPPPLLPRVAGGEDGAVEAFVARYGPAVWSLARRLCPSHADAEDAAQEVFVELWRHAGRFDVTAGSEWTFVLTVARRRLIDRLRRHGRRQDVAVGGAGRDNAESPLARLGDAAAGPAERAQAAEEQAAAVRALDRVSADQRKVLTLSLFDGLSYPEIGDRLAMPLGTVKTHARRGLIRLRQVLAGEA